MDESKVTRYATEKYVDKNNITDSEIDAVFDELSMKSIKSYKINYDYNKSICTLNPAPSYMYENDGVCIYTRVNEDYVIESITVMQGTNDITNNVIDTDNGYIKLNSINDDINIKIVLTANMPS